ncbi:MAG: YnbE family lipoprotein [Parvularculaceae bacterium]
MNGMGASRAAGLVSYCAVGALALSACVTAKIQAPDKPIEINLNVRIDQEVRIKLDKEVEDLIANNPDIF